MSPAVTLTSTPAEDARLFRAESRPWIEPEGHFDAFPKLLVNPDNGGARHLDFRVSIYRPRGRVEVHTHTTAEHVYYILGGAGLLELDGVAHLVEANTCIYIPPGVAHGLENSGFENLLFIVVTSPPGGDLAT